MTGITMQQVEIRRNRFDFGTIGIRIGTYIILFALMLFFMFPFYTMIVASFMERTALNSITPQSVAESVHYRQLHRPLYR